MNYQEVLKLKKSIGFNQDGSEVIVTDRGFDFRFFVTPALDSDFDSYMNAFDLNFFSDFSATSFSTNNQFRLRIISADKNPKQFINIDFE